MRSGAPEAAKGEKVENMMGEEEEAGGGRGGRALAEEASETGPRRASTLKSSSRSHSQPSQRRLGLPEGSGCQRGELMEVTGDTGSGTADSALTAVRTR